MRCDYCGFDWKADHRDGCVHCGAPSPRVVESDAGADAFLGARMSWVDGFIERPLVGGGSVNIKLPTPQTPPLDVLAGSS